MPPDWLPYSVKLKKNKILVCISEIEFKFVGLKNEPEQLLQGMIVFKILKTNLNVMLNSGPLLFLVRTVEKQARIVLRIPRKVKND